MKVLLVGFSGFLGRHIAKILLNNDYQLRIMLNRHTITRREYKTMPEVEVVWGSFADPDVIKTAVEGVDCVIHSGWAFSRFDAQRPTVNETGTQQLFEACVEAGVKKYIFLSSVAVYGMGGTGVGLVSETTPFASGEQASFVYPAEKIATEQWLEGFDRKEMELVLFRPGPIFDEKKGPAKKLIKLGPWRIGLNFGHGKNHMAYVHVEDVAEAIVLGVDKASDGTAFNIVASQQLLFSDWIRVWGRRKGLEIRPFFLPPWFLRFAGWGASQLKKAMGKGKVDVEYPIAAATRDMVYSNEAAKQALGWSDSRTEEYTRLSSGTGRS